MSETSSKVEKIVCRDNESTSITNENGAGSQNLVQSSSTQNTSTLSFVRGNHVAASFKQSENDDKNITEPDFGANFNGEIDTLMKNEPSVIIEDVSALFGESSTRQSEYFDPDRTSNINNETMDDVYSLSSDNTSDTSITEADLSLVNFSDYEDSLQHFTKGFGLICKMNTELKKHLNDLKQQHELEAKALDEIRISNANLVAEIEQIKNEAKNQIEALKREHEQDIERMKEEHQGQIENAKKNKYCMGCGNSKPLDIYLCNIECQRKC